MLKLIRGLVLSLVVIAMNAYVPPTYAASANVIITHIQAGGAGMALEELIIIYNNSSSEVDITDWCVRNKHALPFACFRPDQITERLYLPGEGYATLASIQFAQAYQTNIFTELYTPMNGSGGDIVGSSDTIGLVTPSGEVIDAHSWSTGLAGGSVLERKLHTELLTYIDTDQPSDWQVSVLQNVPPSGVISRDENADLCLNIDGLQTEVPDGLEQKWDGRCLPPVSQLYITELLPNASGSDVGHEFIELYNPHDYDVSLEEYSLNVGPMFENSYSFPAGSMIAAKSYVAFDNAAIEYSLLNTSSRVQLTGGVDQIFDETPSYENPKDDMAWAFIDGSWQYAAPTPAAANRASTSPPVGGESVKAIKLCAANQYRSPETNRCRLIAVPVGQSPCKDGQYRSKETNRCRNISAGASMPKPCEQGQERNEETGRCRNVVVASTLAACKEGQERNPETNRCRNIVAMTKADYSVLGTTSSSGGGTWYIWAAIIGLLLAALGYAAWEWRYELGKFFARVSKFVPRRK